MTCKNCGNALGNEQAICPFCGSFLDASQISTWKKELQTEKSKMRPVLLSERYGMSPIKYERQNAKLQTKLIVILVIMVLLVFVFLGVVFIIF
ncbi:MAG: hypothetical protein HFH86_03890 [Bacilli bacterium]|jgi:uncharacterized membrane protein YvbJ|nr:hypothetical protein [Bacilli bacterium]